MAGARGAKAEPGCRTAIVTIAVTALLLSPFIALIPAVAVKLFAGGEGATSLLIGAQGVGAVAGALSLASLAWPGVRAPAGADGRPARAPVPAPAVRRRPVPAVAAVALVAVGADYVGVLSGLGTVVQLRAPERPAGRILSLYMVALGMVYPLGRGAPGGAGRPPSGLRTVTAVARWRSSSSWSPRASPGPTWWLRSTTRRAAKRRRPEA